MIVGCARDVQNLYEVSTEPIIEIPEEGKALIVFMRPSGIGLGIKTSVFEIKEEKPLQVGSVSAKSKLSYQVTQGNIFL